MTRTSNECRILIFVEDAYEDLELWYPKLRLIEAGIHVTVAGPKTGQKYVARMATRACLTPRLLRWNQPTSTA